VGDGTTSVVIVAAELLKRANELVRAKIHPTSIISGYRLAMREVGGSAALVLSQLLGAFTCSGISLRLLGAAAAGCRWRCQRLRWCWLVLPLTVTLKRAMPCPLPSPPPTYHPSLSLLPPLLPPPPPLAGLQVHH
jgi:hypothetical protein